MCTSRSFGSTTAVLQCASSGKRLFLGRGVLLGRGNTKQDNFGGESWPKNADRAVLWKTLEAHAATLPDVEVLLRAEGPQSGAENRAVLLPQLRLRSLAGLAQYLLLIRPAHAQPRLDDINRAMDPTISSRRKGVSGGGGGATR